MPGFVQIDSPYPYRFRPNPAAAAVSGEAAREVGTGEVGTGEVGTGEVGTGDPRTPGQMAADCSKRRSCREGADNVAAFIGEPVQGAGGVIVPPDDYWPRIRQICDRHQVLLIADEVITGFGRTGDWFALGRYGSRRTSSPSPKESRAAIFRSAAWA